VTLVAESAQSTLFDAPQARTVEVYVTRDDEPVSKPKEVKVGGDAASAGSA
jgi:hypothetical protein